VGAAARCSPGAGRARGRSWRPGGPSRRAGCRAGSCSLRTGTGLSPGGTGTCRSAGSPAWQGGSAGTFLAAVRHLHGPKLPLLPDLLEDLLVERPLLLGQGPQPPFRRLRDARMGPQVVAAAQGQPPSGCLSWWGQHPWDHRTPPSPAQAPPCHGGVPVPAPTCFRGGRERMKSRMSSWASFFTRGGMSPSTWERAEGPRAVSVTGPVGGTAAGAARRRSP